MPVPTGIKKIDDTTLGIVWDDGKECRYSLRLLRRECPCATCRARRSEKKVAQDHNGMIQLSVISNEVSEEDTVLKRVDWVGNYALKLTWADGHDTGNYTYDYLRGLCGREGDEIRASG